MVVHSEKVTEEHKGRDCDDDASKPGSIIHQLTKITAVKAVGSRAVTDNCSIVVQPTRRVCARYLDNLLHHLGTIVASTRKDNSVKLSEITRVGVFIIRTSLAALIEREAALNRHIGLIPATGSPFAFSSL
ncbi:hypothetical protein RRG08_066759 [Elysia crispata]|uniref:Uncharacterized protein n=1 Tax=Elysia crispata TaxID=231223 RepID=A0AAE0XQ16_9GAST|nr:hypothetical protein RRG08_066759 [Elysia crispata]